MNDGHDLLADPVTGAGLSPASTVLVGHLQMLAVLRALRDESAQLVEAGFEGAWLAADRQRAWLVRAGVADFRPGAAVLLRADDPI